MFLVVWCNYFVNILCLFVVISISLWWLYDFFFSFLVFLCSSLCLSRKSLCGRLCGDLCLFVVVWFCVWEISVVVVLSLSQCFVVVFCHLLVSVCLFVIIMYL